MDKGIRNTLIWIAAFIALVLGMFLAARMMPREPTPEQLAQWGYYRYDSPRSLKDFALVDHNGKAIDAAYFKGDWHLVFFGFTFCPDVCPTTMAVLNQAVSGREDAPQVVMVSVDPERDTPEQLAHYVPGFNESFVGVTGDFDNIVKLATQVNVAFGKVPGPEEGTYLVDHSANIVVLDPDGRYYGFIKAPHRAEHLRSIMDTFD